ncbi:hypothetical protein [Paenibacillus koleovorans]|uniref:hypothetical protein n=1 Tax=Paenibacillus koleovorans TaxID=121608 RepID=UPI000FD91164|nr:hypothetical protein [Paenibacillus koleovorans]
MDAVEPQAHTRIMNAKGQRHQGECLLTWEWPRDIQHVYVYPYKPGEELAVEELLREHMKLVTREEYRASAGFREKSEFIGTRLYRLFPCVKEEGGLKLIAQLDQDNLVQIKGDRAQIRYSIQYGFHWFGKLKPAHIELFCEVNVPKGVLCYAKKPGSEPLSKDDGVMYMFGREFQQGRQKLPQFEVGRDEYVRVFLSDGKQYGDAFELIREK